MKKNYKRLSDKKSDKLYVKWKGYEIHLLARLIKKT